MELKLVVDPNETEFPGPISELLKQATRQHPVRATITPDNYCVFVCSNVLYVFQNKNLDNMRMLKLNLPNADGMQYNTGLIALFKHRDSRSIYPSVVAVSPQGVIRYWYDPSKPHKELNLGLGANQLALSLTLVDAKDHIHRFLLSTASASTLYFVQIFHNRDDEDGDSISHFHMNVASTAGLGRRMSMMLFGSSSGSRDTIALKSLFVKGKLRSKNIDAVIVLPRALHFLSLDKVQLLHQENVAEDAIAHWRRSANSSENVSATQVEIVDAGIYSKGILMLVAVKHDVSPDKRFVKVDFYIGHLVEKYANTGEYTSWYTRLALPDSIVNMERSKLRDCRLVVPNERECVIVFLRSVVVIEHPTKKMEASILEDMGGYALGAAVVDESCFVLLQDQGVCALRRLPQDFDSELSRVYRRRLQSLLDNRSFGNEIFNRAFIAFVEKDLTNAKAYVGQLQNLNVAKLAVEFAAYFLDVQPEELRWTYDKSTLTADQLASLESKRDDLSNVRSARESVLEKLRFHGMFLMFLRYCNLLNKMLYPDPTLGNRSGAIQLVEMMEKLYVASRIIFIVIKHVQQTKETARNSLLLKSVTILGPEFARRFRHTKNKYLSNFDHVFQEISHIDEVLYTAVLEGESSRGGKRSIADRLERLYEVGSTINIAVDALKLARDDDLVAQATKDANHSTNFNGLWLYRLVEPVTQHFNEAMSLLGTLGDGFHELPAASDVLANCQGVAHFLLSHQTEEERAHSQIIAEFHQIGQHDIAVELAEIFHVSLHLLSRNSDFGSLINYCHTYLDEATCRKRLNAYKEQFSAQDFELFLFQYYKKNGMVNELLDDKSERVSKFLADHKSINWIRNISNGQYVEAFEILKGMAAEAKDTDKKLVVFALCKLCLLSQDGQHRDAGEIAEVSNSIRVILDEIKG